MKVVLRSLAIIIVLITTFFPAYAQWNLEWSSNGVPSGLVAGWVPFQGSGDSWQYRYYTLDTLAFRVMSASLSQTPQYVYTFTAPERLAGEVIYSLGVDLTGDQIVEFYALSAYGTASPYRQSIKVFDITNGQIIAERNIAGYSYTDASVWDVDGDGTYECVFTRYDYPAGTTYSYEVFNTGVSGLSEHAGPVRTFDLKQNYPNPFNPATRIDYQLTAPSRVELNIVNVLGQKVKTLVDESQGAGAHSVMWDGKDAAGQAQASGAYYYQIRVNGQAQQARQMILLK